MKISTGLVVMLLLVTCTTVFAQKGSVIRGVVSASDTKQPLERVVIIEKNTQNHVFSGVTGDYSITLSQENATLVFSYVGYTTQQLTVGGQTALDVVLLSSQKDLNEVVVTAFGIKKEKRSLGYTVQQVDSKDLNINHQSNVVNALQGKVSGVQISSAGGGPGQGARIIIRGINSLADRNNQPLFIVDGVEIDNSTYTTGGSESRGMSNRAADINPDDIESVSVLKGGAATALYGIRAANGAIIITTKTAKSGKLQVTYSGMYGFDKVNKIPDVQSKFSQGYLGVYDAASFWPTWGPTVADAKALDPGHPAQLYNNYKQAFKTGTQTRHTVNVSGGTEKAQVIGSFSYGDQEGVIPFSDYTTYNARVNAQFKISEKISAGVSLNYINSGGNRVNADRYGEQIIYWSPRWDMKDYLKDDNTQQTYSSGTNNPMYTLYSNKFRDNVNRTIASSFIRYAPAKWLNFSYRFGNDFYTDGRTHTAPGPLGLVGEAVNLDDNGYGFVDEYNLRSRIITSTLMANISHTFNKFSIDLKLGHDLRDQKLRRNGVEGDTLVVPDLFLLGNAKRVRGESYIYDYRNYGYFADLTLGFNNYLFLELTDRNDFTSTLSKENRSYFYPSVSLSYIFSDQFKLPSWWTYGKFKFSYAKIGKDGDPYAITNGFSTGNPIGFSVPFYQSRTLGNPGLRPEFTQTKEIGTELRFLDNRLGLEVVAYQQKSKDLIVPVNVSNTTGFDKAYVNAGEIQNKGLEVTLSATPVRTKDFNWDFRINFSTNKNKVIELNQGLDEIVISTQSGYLSSSVTSKLVPGRAYGALFGRNYLRYYADTKDDDKVTLRKDLPMVIGANGFPVLESASVQRYLGSTLPKWLGSTLQTFRYKQLALSVLVDVRQGQYKYNQLSNFLSAFGESKITENRDQTIVFKGVLADGTPNSKPVYLGQGVGPDGVNYSVGFYRNYFRGASENFVEDASWVRLRSVSLSYSIPASWLKISGASVSFTGNNLWLHTKYTGFDPETSSTSAGSNASDSFSGFTYPATKSYLFSVNLQF